MRSIRRIGAEAWAPACAGARSPGGERGFTLIEMLVALTVFSLAALALLRLESATLSDTATLESRAFGQLVARNIAAETLADPSPPTLGISQGAEANGGRPWRWVRRTAPTANPDLLRIDIAVTDLRGDRVGSLTVVRPTVYPPEGPAPAAPTLPGPPGAPGS